MSRWTITPYGGGTAFVFPINPNQVDHEVLAVSSEWQQALGDTTFIGKTARRQLTKLTFSGVMPTREAYDGLVALTAGPRHVLVDDLGRSWTLRVLEVHPTTKAPMRRRQPWRHLYSVVALILDGPTGP